MNAVDAVRRASKNTSLVDAVSRDLLFKPSTEHSRRETNPVCAGWRPASYTTTRPLYLITQQERPTSWPAQMLKDKCDICVVVNAKDITLTGNKLTDKKYYWHTGYADAYRSLCNLVTDECNFDCLLMS